MIPVYSQGRELHGICGDVCVRAALGYVWAIRISPYRVIVLTCGGCAVDIYRLIYWNLERALKSGKMVCIEKFKYYTDMLYKYTSLVPSKRYLNKIVP